MHATLGEDADVTAGNSNRYNSSCNCPLGDFDSALGSFIL
jgi:hypothetical protein